MNPKITGIHHLALKCHGIDEYEKTVKFYHEILGMPIARTWGEGVESGIMIDSGAGLLEIFANAEDYPETSIVRHFAFDVENTDACIDAVRTAGYKITMEPTDIVIASNPPYPARIAF